MKREQEKAAQLKNNGEFMNFDDKRERLIDDEENTQGQLIQGNDNLGPVTQEPEKEYAKPQQIQVPQQQIHNVPVLPQVAQPQFSGNQQNQVNLVQGYPVQAQCPYEGVDLDYKNSPAKKGKDQYKDIDYQPNFDYPSKK